MLFVFECCHICRSDRIDGQHVFVFDSSSYYVVALCFFVVIVIADVNVVGNRRIRLCAV